ncbi:DNA primsae/helicase [Gordonia phage Aphelion]|uniref:DNA primsae/helicase n=2 Tax=Smoothievirus TaxID=1982557 RepID=A0A410TD88_9CAUD|nr:DNA primase/helicase [Gordonia phage ClubL]ANA86621.1 DNA primsae/helicase [Gordonia phage ClubL]QAU06987.1 DNA primsae/helicase [Gordonia phage Aphelion]QYC53606.1 DNA primase/helicase [Gordonia phage Norvs]WNM66393.1 DNA primase/helicase [Gordonia phage Culver]
MNQTAYDRVIDAFRQYGSIVEEKSNGVASVQAPGHSGADRSVSVTAIEGQVLVHCFSEPTDEILDKIGLTVADLFDNPKGVDYRYDDGRVVHRSTDKKFFQQGNTGGSKLYRASKLGEAEEIWFAEGEKDVHALERLGLVATTNAGGAANIKNFDLTPLHGKRLVIIRDDDEAGMKHANALWSALSQDVRSIRVVTSAAGKDAADHVAAQLGVDDFIVDESFASRVVQRELWQTWKDNKDAEPDVFLAVLEKEIRRLRPPQDLAQMHSWDNALTKWFEWYEAPESERRVIPTPWPKLNQVLAGGFHAGRSYLVVARPGVGKSLVLGNGALFAAMEAWQQTALFSLEMGHVEIVSRMLAAGGDANYGQITKREIDDFNFERISQFFNRSAGMPLMIGDTPNLNIDKAFSYVDTLANREEGLDIAFFDYAQLIKGRAGQSTTEANEEVSRGLKVMSRTYNIPVVSAAQANREGVKDGGAPKMQNIRGAGAYEQDADVIIILDLETEPAPPHMPTGMIDFIVTKNRTGPQQTISMQWRPNRAKITE